MLSLARISDSGYEGSVSAICGVDPLGDNKSRVLLTPRVYLWHKLFLLTGEQRPRRARKCENINTQKDLRIKNDNLS